MVEKQRLNSLEVRVVRHKIMKNILYLFTCFCYCHYDGEYLIIENVRPLIWMRAVNKNSLITSIVSTQKSGKTKKNHENGQNNIRLSLLYKQNWLDKIWLVFVMTWLTF